MIKPQEQNPVLQGTIPLFPLEGVLLLPGSELPLNIFEPRYIALVEDCLRDSRIMGLIQPSGEQPLDGKTPLYSVGCAGRIISFTETEDRRYLITVRGLCRFEILEEKAPVNGSRVIEPDWKKFVTDLNAPDVTNNLDRKKLTELIGICFKQLGIQADWDLISSAESADLIASLAMACPFAPNEKQALLEATTMEDRAELLLSLLEMACFHRDGQNKPRH